MAKYEMKNGAAIFPEGITIIEREAFRNCEELTSVTIPLIIELEPVKKGKK